MKKPRHKRTAAQAEASKKWAAAGRSSQAHKRAFNRAHNLPPPRSGKQHQQSLKAAAAGRQAQARKRHHLKPLPKHPRALAYEGEGVGAGSGDGVGVGVDGGIGGGVGYVADDDAAGAGVPILYQPVLWPACVATAIANHLLWSCGIAASQQDIIALHLAAGGDDERGILIADVLELLTVRGLAGTRIRRFWPVAGWNLPGLVAGLRLPRGAHTVLTLDEAACASWGANRPVTGYVEEAWWIEWLT